MNYYEILGLSKKASYEDIKKSYKKLAIKFHPDKNPNYSTHEIFKKVTEAYKTLIDPYKRGKYDAMLEQRDYHGIDRMFGMEFMTAMDSFNKIFGNDPFFRSNVFSFPRFSASGIPKGAYYSSYSSSAIQTADPNGKIRTKRKIRVNSNGKNDIYEDEFYIDKDGKKHYIRTNGNPQLKLNYGVNQASKRNKRNDNKTYRLTYK